MDLLVNHVIGQMGAPRPSDGKVMSDWKTTYEFARSKMLDSTRLLRQYLELPIQVKHVWDGYPVVDAALISLEEGWFLDSCLLADATYTDDRVAAVLNTRTNAVFALPMEFKYQGQEEETEHDEQILSLKQGIRDLVRKYWDEMLPLSTMREWFRWGILVNLGVGENVWAYHQFQMDVESKLLDQMDAVFLPVMKTWNTQNCYWRWDTRSFWIVHQDGQTELHPGDGRWVTYSPQGHNHGWLYGTIRQLGKLWLDRVYTYRDWARAEEKFALGVVKAYEPAAAQPADKVRFEAQVTNMPPEATVILPKLPGDQGNFDLEMMDTQQVGTGWEIFERRADRLNRDIAVLLLGQNLTTESQQGSNSGQGRGNAKVQDSVRKDYLKADAISLSHAIKTQILAPFVKYNFEWAAGQLGISWRELIPEVTWQVEPPQDEQIRAKAFADVAGGISALATSPAAQMVDYAALLERHDIPSIQAEKQLAPPPPGDNDERPRKPLLDPVADPDPRSSKSASRQIPLPLKGLVPNNSSGL